jgi:hypothetical protein
MRLSATEVTALAVVMLLGAGDPAWASAPQPTQVASVPDEPGLLDLASSARADASAEPWRHAIKLDIGLFSATGFGGASFVYAPWDALQLEAAVGYGFSGVQLSVMPKVAAGTRHDRYVGGVGIAVAVPVPDVSMIDTAGLWLNIDLAGYEHRFQSGFAMSVAVGFTVGLAGGRFEASHGPPEYGDIAGGFLPQIRLSIAQWY